MKLLTFRYFLDSKLNFDSHITFLCKKADLKLSALVRIDHYSFVPNFRGVE